MIRKIRKLHSSTLTYFIAVAEEGSFRAAARKIRIASSAVNRHILLLEEELGFTLFERQGRTLKLSAAGQILFDHCQGTVRSFEDALEDLDALRDVRSGLVRISASESFAAEIVPKICVEFSQAFPGIRLQVAVAESGAVISSIADDMCDVGFAFGKVNIANLRAVSCHDLPIGAVVGPDHPLASHDSVTLAECRDYPIVTPDENLSFGRRLNELSNLESRHKIAGIVGSSPRLMAGIARLNKHIAFQTRIGITDEIDRGALVFVPISDASLKPDTCMILASRRSEGRFASERFCDFSRDAISALLDGRPKPA